MTEYTHGGLFEGIGVFSLAAHLNGMKTMWQVEIDKDCQQVLRKHFPHAALYGDIHECHNLPYVDVLTAGFPCQPYSTNGKMQGENDPRYLVPQMLRIIDETQPRVCLFENVPAFTTITHGDTFRKFLGELARMGYDAEWGRFRAADFGASHKRERWFCVAYPHSVGRADNGRGWHRGNENGFNSPPQQKRHNVQFGTETPVTLGYATSAGCKQSTQFDSDGHVRAGLEYPIEPPQGEFYQSCMGGNVDGFTCGLDGLGLPVAPPASAQYAHEPPRLLDTEPPNAAARVRSLGNAIYAPVAIALMSAIRQWLNDEDTPCSN